MSATETETATSTPTPQSYNLDDEFSKIKDALGALWAKIPHASEEEATAVANLIDAIGPQPEPEPVEEPVAPTADPLAGMSVEELQAELAKRQAGQ